MKVGDNVICLYPEKDVLYSYRLKKYKTYKIKYFSSIYTYKDTIFIDDDTIYYNIECFVKLSEYRKLKLIKLKFDNKK